MPMTPLRRPRSRPTAVVLGDLLLDVTVAPQRPLVPGSDVPGEIAFRQGGAAGTTARWLARLGIRTRLVTSVGRDAPGRALLEMLDAQGVDIHAIRPAGLKTGRTGVLLLAEGGRCLIDDRGAADALAPEHLQPAWFAGIAALHLPGYALLVSPLGEAARAAVRLARAESAIVSLDLAASEPVAERGRRTALAAIRELAPDVLFGTPPEVAALLPGRPFEALLELAPVAVVKRGANGATALAIHGDTRLRLDVATEPHEVADPTGAGDAFDAGFLAAWLASRAEASGRIVLQRAVASGHRVAARHLTGQRPEIRLG